MAAVTKAKEAGENPYPHKFDVQLSVPQFIDKYGDKVEAGSHFEEETSVAGRVQFKRAAGAKLIFYTLAGEGKSIQVMADQRTSELADDTDAFTALHAGVKRGDIIGVRGKPGASKRGELSIFPVHMQARRVLLC